MALLKTYKKAGYEFEYWNIIGLDSNKVNQTTKITVALFKDKKTRTENASNYILTMSFNLSYAETIAEAYTLLKETKTHIDAETKDESMTPFFADAKDN